MISCRHARDCPRAGDMGRTRVNLQPIRGRARTGLPALLLGAALLFTTACSGGGTGGGSGGDDKNGGGKPGTEASKAVVSVKPDDGVVRRRAMFAMEAQ
jgi:hypothetical protein